MLACLFPLCTGHDGRQLDEIQHSLQHLLAEVASVKRLQRAILTKEGIIMASQDDIDAAVASISTAVTDLGTQNAAIQTAQANFDTELQTLLGQVGTSVDTSALVAAGQALAEATGQLDSTVTTLQNDPNLPAAPVTTDPGTPTDGGDVPAEPTTPVGDSTPSV